VIMVVAVTVKAGMRAPLEISNFSKSAKGGHSFSDRSNSMIGGIDTLDRPTFVSHLK